MIYLSVKLWCLRIGPITFSECFDYFFWICQMVNMQQPLEKKWILNDARLDRGPSLSHQYLTNVQSCYRRFGRETIHPTKKFILMNLLQIPCVITWA